jgi:hypothetical protein
MSSPLLRRIFALLFSVALIGALPTQVVPVIAVGGGSSMTMMATDTGSDTNGSPCKGMTADCMTDLGCIFAVGLPAPQAIVATRFAWSPVTYWASANHSTGRTLAPDLGPPIHIA